ncbi:hypothetical protein D0Y65_033565 [Glycine soja]|uniref:Uncharacterized protein n=1 Tax=Glycine soja TaxID=3848 RepID=A0A445HLK3_GLYSO|nr:hypothetical protein D0Y65_033565 [Glycine soja]
MSSDPAKDLAKWKLEEVISIVIVCVVFLTLSHCFGIFKHHVYGICCGRNQVQRRLLDESIADEPSAAVSKPWIELYCGAVSSHVSVQEKRERTRQDN